MGIEKGANYRLMRAEVKYAPGSPSSKHSGKFVRKGAGIKNLCTSPKLGVASRAFSRLPGIKKKGEFLVRPEMYTTFLSLFLPRSALGPGFENCKQKKSESRARFSLFFKGEL